MVSIQKKGLSLCVLCGLCGELISAPPAVTTVFPAGGQRGAVVDVTASGTFDTWPCHVWSSDSGIQAVAENEKGKFRVAVGPAVVPGVHWLRFYDPSGASALRPFVVGTLPDVTEKEPNDDLAKAQVVSGNAVVNGRLEKMGDVDGFAVPLKMGQTLVASLDAHFSLRSPMDGILQIVSPTGAVLAENHDHRGLDPQIVFPAPADGTYVVRLFAFPSTPDSSIRHFGSDACVYRLTLTTGGFVDHATPLAASRDTFPPSVRGWNSLPAFHTRVGSDTISPVWHLDVANVIRVRTEPHPCIDATVVGPQPVLPAPVSITGQLIRTNQSAVHSVRLKKGQPVTVAVESASFGLPVAPVVRVLDPTGQAVARGEPKLNEDTNLTFTPAIDGTFGVEVRDQYGAAGPRNVFLVRVVPAEPDFNLSTANDRLTLVPGKPLEVPLSVSRVNGFDAELEWMVEGHPAGVSCGVVPPAKPDPKSATLRFTAEPMAWSGPVRIVGSRKGKPGPSRPVRAPNADFDQPTADLWLTIGADATPAVPTKPKKK